MPTDNYYPSVQTLKIQITNVKDFNERPLKGNVLSLGPHKHV